MTLANLAFLLVLILVVARIKTWLVGSPSKFGTELGVNKLHPRYAQAFYTELKSISEQPREDCVNQALAEDIVHFSEAVSRTKGANSFAYQLNVFDDFNDPDGRMLIWRGDYSAPDKQHVLQMSGQDIDEWVIIGDKAWSGPLFMVGRSVDFPHAATQVKLTILPVIDRLMFHSQDSLDKIWCSSDRKSLRLKGPFPEQIDNDLLQNSDEVYLSITDCGHLERIDFEYSDFVPNGVATGSARFTFGAFDKEMPIGAPPSGIITDEHGKQVVNSLEIPELPFFDFE